MLRLTSSNSGATIEFSQVQGDSFHLSVLHLNYSASRSVSAYTDPDGIARLWADAAREWRGWHGAKVWESLEGELRIQLSTDRAGHVELRVRLRSDAGVSDPWSIETSIGLDAGALESIARDAKRLWAQGG
jgi:hypothetical protein